ncbi:MAG: hypothetical protein AABY79_00605 [Nitrospirota bacterium]|jgi:rubrerythrin
MNEDMHKLTHLLEHWIEHNDDHMQNYLDWADRAEKAGYPDVAKQLKNASDATKEATKFFKEAAVLLNKKQ